MHRRIDTTLRRLRHDLTHHRDPAAVHEVCRQLGHVWRRCLLTPFAIVHWFRLQVLHGNTAPDHISLRDRRGSTDSAYCQARARLPLAVFRAVLRNLTGALVPDTERDGLWRGHRAFFIDGSSFSMSDTPELQAHFGRPGNQKVGCGFPVAKILALFHAGTGLLLEVTAAPPRSHEMAHVDGAHPVLKPGDVLVGDRGFCSFAHVAPSIGRGVQAVFRIHQRRVIDFTPGRPHAVPGAKRSAGRPRSRWLRSPGPLDQVVEWLKPADRPEWMAAGRYAALPETVTVREARYRVVNPGSRTRVITVVTTLLDGELYPPAASADLYLARRPVEQNLRDLKQTMRMDVLRCQSVDGVLQELTVYAMVHNLVRVVMGEAARRPGVGVDRISFIDALRWLLAAEPGEAIPALVVNPIRPGRGGPRVKERRPEPYSKMNWPRSVLRKRLMAQAVGA